MLEQVVVLHTATVVLTVIACELGDTEILEGNIGNTCGLQLGILCSKQEVDHLTAILAAVEQTGINQIHHCCHKERIVGGCGTAAVGILHQGLQLGHITGQTVESELRHTIFLVVTDEGDLMGLGRIKQLNCLHGDGISGNALHFVYQVRIVVNCSAASRCPGHTTIIQIECRCFRHITRRRTETHIVGCSCSQQVTAGGEVQILMQGIAVGEVVLHRGSHTIVGAGVRADDGHSKLYSIVFLSSLCK